MIASAIMPGWGGMADVRARSLRKNATEAERILWSALREFKKHGLHFRRQAPIGRYIADFACHRSKIIVEIDGSQHTRGDALAYDKERTKFLKSRGYRVLRFWNNDVTRNLHEVCDAIVALAKTPPTRSAFRASTSPRRGR